jgi:hypothetical protein
MLTYADRTGPMQEDVVAKGNSMREFVQQRVKEMPPPNMCVREKHAVRGRECPSVSPAASSLASSLAREEAASLSSCERRGGSERQSGTREKKREKRRQERQTDRDKNEMPPQNICVRENGIERDARDKREGEREKWEGGWVGDKREGGKEKWEGGWVGEREREKCLRPNMCVRVNAAEREREERERERAREIE